MHRLLSRSLHQRTCLRLQHVRLQSTATTSTSGQTFPLPSSPSLSHLSPTHGSAEPGAEARTVQDLSNKYLLPVYARPPFVLSHGEGSYVWDTDGRRYLDFTAGIAVNALGHSDKGVAEVLASQASQLLHTSNVYHNVWASRLAELIVELTRQNGGLGLSSTSSSGEGAKVFFTNSGTEANEGALKIARKVGKDRGGNTKTRIVCFEQSFHGRSMGSLSVTANAKYQAPFEPLIPGVDVGKLNCSEEELKQLVGEETCAVIVEPIQGEGGINFAREDWLKALRRRCDEVGAVLVFDEIQCGLYRTGKLWAHSWYDRACHPDIVTMAKPLANGYPIGAVLMRDEVAATMTAGTHGTTFGGSPLACAVGHHVLTRLSSPALEQNIVETGGYLFARLSQLPKWFPDLLEEGVRGRGMILGLGFRDASVPGRVVSLARERGLFVLGAGKDAVRMVPSLTISRTEVDEAVAVLESCLYLVSQES